MGDESTSTTPTCKRSYVWDKKKGKCVKVKRSSNLTDDNLYEAGRDLAYAKRYDEAIAVLNLAKNQQDPRILNYLGYSTRKTGKVREGLAFYRAAIAINPNYTLARSYMGEAYLQLGDRKNAELQLAEIKARCVGECPEYAALETAPAGQPAKTTW